MELGPNNHGAKVEEYQTYDSLPGEGYAWCNSFVDYCFAKAGRPLEELLRSAGVELTLSLAHKNGWIVSDPAPGDLVIYTFSHIGIVEKLLPGGQLQTIEGNTGESGAVSDSRTGGDGVYRKIRSTQLVRAYVRVPGNVSRVKGRWPEPVLKQRLGYWAWLAWTLGEGDWSGYTARALVVRPNVPKVIPPAWWVRRIKFLSSRKGVK